MGSLFGSAPRAAPAPTPDIKPPTVMPDPDKEAVQREEFRKLAKARRRTTTRENTIIGSDGDTLG